MITIAINILGLLIGLVAAILMYYFPPSVTLYTEKGEPRTNWVANPTVEGKRRGPWQLRLSKVAPWLLAIAFLLQLVAAIISNCETQRAEGINRSRIAELTSKLADKTASENLELQEKCATQAEKVFRQLGYSLSKDLATNQSHFNAKLNKCFMSFVVTDLRGGYSQSRYLIDAYEQRGYAEFLMSKPSAFTNCILTPLAEKERVCKSEAEYTAFVARYME